MEISSIQFKSVSKSTKLITFAFRLFWLAPKIIQLYNDHWEFLKPFLLVKSISIKCHAADTFIEHWVYISVIVLDIHIGIIWRAFFSSF